MDAAEAPVRGDLYQVRPPVAVRNHVVDILVKVQDVLAVSKVPLVLVVEGEVEEGLLKVKAVVVIAVATASVRMSVISLPVTIKIATLVFIGQDLDWNRRCIVMVDICHFSCSMHVFHSFRRKKNIPRRIW